MNWAAFLGLIVCVLLVILLRRNGLPIDRAGSDRARRLNLQVFAPIACGLALIGPLLGLAWRAPTPDTITFLNLLVFVLRVMLAGACITLGVVWLSGERAVPLRSIRLSAIVGALALFLLSMADSIALSDANLILLIGAAWLWWQHELPIRLQTIPPTQGMLLFAPLVIVVGILVGILLALVPAPAPGLVAGLAMLLLACAGLALFDPRARSASDDNDAPSPSGFALVLCGVLPPLAVAGAAQSLIISDAVQLARITADEFDAPLRLALLDAFSLRSRVGGLHVLTPYAWLGLALAFFSGVVPLWKTFEQRIFGALAFTAGIALLALVFVAG
ncbi:MAG: hypothetical protein EA380_08540 [Phycisphaeraceae bacterium]|nr:MAG: hypothetical protein EA380_08540 [Phycisphaeraceae bacterium]